VIGNKIKSTKVLDPPLLASALEETMSVARLHFGVTGKSADWLPVDGATPAQTLGQCNKSLLWTAVPFECAHVCYLVQITTQVHKAKQSCGWNVLASALEETMSGHATSSLFHIHFFFSLSLSLGSLWFLRLSLRGQRQAAKTVKKLIIFFTVLKTVKKSKKKCEEIIYFLHCFLISSSFPTLYNLYFLFFTVF
jgi:hypothetical protein